MDPVTQAEQIYRDSLVIDGLNVSRWSSPNVYNSLHSGGVTAINATIAVWEGYEATLDNIAEWYRRFDEFSNLICQGNDISDIEDAKKQGKTAVVFGWQNGSPIENNLDRLSLFHNLGVRIIQITYNERNLIGNGCLERHDDGLSQFGLDVVKEMDRLGIVIDLSHVGDRTTMEAIETSENPVAFTHANARSFFDHVRNKPDDALKALADKGGVVGANAFPIFLRTGYESTLKDYVDSIDDLVNRIGIDHVGIGTDFCQDQPYSFFEWLFARQGIKLSDKPVPIANPHFHPEGLERPDSMVNIAKELLERGYDKEDISKVLGGNWMRLFGQVWGC